ncbi:hypothetical protein LTS09_018277, partial [Friedmanniomyces endolithicus]
DASWGFTVFSIIAPLASVAGILLLCLVILIANWVATMDYQKKRFYAPEEGSKQEPKDHGNTKSDSTMFMDLFLPDESI